MPENLSKPLLISIVGPTAVGKTAMSIALAKRLRTEIISADSRQFYRETGIGTAKPSDDELNEVKHHFINSHSISETYNAGEFGRNAEAKLQELFAVFSAVLVVGGSGLYLKALWEGLDAIPKIDESIREQLNKEFSENGLEGIQNELQNADPTYYEEVDVNNGQRIIRALEVIRGTGKTFSHFRKKATREMPYRNLKIGLNMNRELLFERIDQRMDLMIECGLFEEAEKLLVFKDHNALQTVGYSEIFRYLNGEYDKKEAVRLLKRNSRRYAKRQLTWFNKYDDIHWFEPHQEKEILALVGKHLS